MHRTKIPFSFRLNLDTAGNPTHRPTMTPTSPVEARPVDPASEDEVRERKRQGWVSGLIWVWEGRSAGNLSFSVAIWSGVWGLVAGCLKDRPRWRDRLSMKHCTVRREIRPGLRSGRAWDSAGSHIWPIMRSEMAECEIRPDFSNPRQPSVGFRPDPIRDPACQWERRESVCRREGRERERERVPERFWTGERNDISVFV
jgi:hypothetical protein